MGLKAGCFRGNEASLQSTRGIITDAFNHQLELLIFFSVLDIFEVRLDI